MSRICKCHLCKESFSQNELINYCTINAKTGYWYCKKCLIKVQEKENFINEVCKIFGIKAPGPRIWTDRKKLQEKYGYSDQTIIDCLHYIYDVEKKSKDNVTLYLVNPVTIDKMIKYKKNQVAKANSLAQAMNTTTKEYVIPIKENTSKKINKIDPDEFLDD